MKINARSRQHNRFHVHVSLKENKMAKWRLKKMEMKLHLRLRKLCGVICAEAWDINTSGYWTHKSCTLSALILKYVLKNIDFN